jgi:broad specificity phosphatase PhoE
VSIEIVFETHSTSVDNERGIATGWLPGELSETGRGQAKQLGERRLNEQIATVFTSDLRRAVQTAGIAFGASGIPIRQDARLRECNYGRLNGMPVAQLDSIRARHVDEPFPDGESYRQVVGHMAEFLSDVGREFDDGRVVVVGHTATRWALDHLLQGRALEDVVEVAFDWQPGWRYVLNVPVG